MSASDVVNSWTVWDGTWHIAVVAVVTGLVLGVALFVGGLGESPVSQIAIGTLRGWSWAVAVGVGCVTGYPVGHNLGVPALLLALLIASGLGLGGAVWGLRRTRLALEPYSVGARLHNGGLVPLPLLGVCAASVLTVTLAVSLIDYLFPLSSLVEKLLST